MVLSDKHLSLNASILEKIATGAELYSCLDSLCHLVEEIVPGGICSVMLLDRERNALFVESAPSVPLELQSLLDGLVPCAAAGSCGTAVYLGDPVYVTDTMTDPRWQPIRSIAETIGIRACWSIPIRGRSGEVFGSFAISHLKQAVPEDAQKELLSTAACLASIAIERSHETKELEAVRDKAMQASLVQAEFLSNMSHEIRTRLTSILGFTDLMLDPELDQTTKESFFQTIKVNSNQLMRVVEDIQDSAKIDAGKMQIVINELSPVTIATEVISEFKAAADKKKIELELSLKTDIPEKIQSDQTRLKQILTNIVDNAIKFTEQGSVHVQLECIPEEELLKFHIADTGTGLSKEQIKALSQFEAIIHAGGTTTRKFGGTGLGLRLCNSLSKMLGGELKVESSLGEGSTFTATIATGGLEGTTWLSKDAEGKGVGVASSTEVNSNSQNGSSRLLDGYRILVAEDGEDNQRLLQYYLESEGAKVSVCNNGRSTLDAIESSKAEDLPHLILLDMQMPQVDGYEVSETLRQAGVMVPIIAMTAHTMNGERERCLDSGCDDYLSKPFEQDELIEICQRWILQAPFVTSSSTDSDAD